MNHPSKPACILCTSQRTQLPRPRRTRRRRYRTYDRSIHPNRLPQRHRDNIHAYLAHFLLLHSYITDYHVTYMMLFVLFAVTSTGKIYGFDASLANFDVFNNSPIPSKRIG